MPVGVCSDRQRKSTLRWICAHVKGQDYSPLYHLFAALFLKPEQCIAMLTLYCDASGKEQDKLISVAGFISTVDEWLLFEKEWATVLDEFKIKYFHMREFAHSVGQFDGWKNDENKRRLLLTRLITVIIARTKYWVASCIRLEDFKKVDADYELHETFYPYPLCSRLCIDMAIRWCEAHHLEDVPIEYVFEHGDEHAGQLLKVVQEKTGQLPIFRTRLQALPLQAADFAAYEVFKAYRRFAIELDLLFEKFRESFELLRAIPNKWGQMEEHNLRVICRISKIAQRGSL